MPEYLAPGVFVEEVSFRAKSIEGVSTTTTGFVGATRYGPLDIEPEIVTSLVEFERVYGGKAKLVFDDGGETDNYMWNAVRAFFEEGGKRLYIARAFTPADEDDDMSGYAARLDDSSTTTASPGCSSSSCVRAIPARPAMAASPSPSRWAPIASRSTRTASMTSKGRPTATSSGSAASTTIISPCVIPAGRYPAGNSRRPAIWPARPTSRT